MSKSDLGDNVYSSHGQFADATPKTMTYGHSRERCRRHPSSSKHYTLWKLILLGGLLVTLSCGTRANVKGFQRNLETFFGMVDQDGNREIEQAEATKFLRELKVQITDESEMETKEDMSELMASSQFDFNFSYGGNSISAEEMLKRSARMLSMVWTSQHL